MDVGLFDESGSVVYGTGSGICVSDQMAVQCMLVAPIALFCEMTCRVFQGYDVIYPSTEHRAVHEFTYASVYQFT